MGELLGAIEEHDVVPLVHSGAGQSIGYFDEVRPVAELMAELVAETTRTVESQALLLEE